MHKSRAARRIGPRPKAEGRDVAVIWCSTTLTGGGLPVVFCHSILIFEVLHSK
jgi:hypothetical protein